jgi:hypothetical protein
MENSNTNNAVTGIEIPFSHTHKPEMDVHEDKIMEEVSKPQDSSNHTRRTKSHDKYDPEWNTLMSQDRTEIMENQNHDMDGFYEGAIFVHGGNPTTTKDLLKEEARQARTIQWEFTT